MAAVLKPGREWGCWPLEASELQNELASEGKKGGMLGWLQIK